MSSGPHVETTDTEQALRRPAGISPPAIQPLTPELVKRLRKLVLPRHKVLFDELLETRRMSLRPFIASLGVELVKGQEDIRHEERAARRQEKGGNKVRADAHYGKAKWLRARHSDGYDRLRKLAKAERDLNPTPPGASYSVTVQGTVGPEQMSLELEVGRRDGFVVDAEQVATADEPAGAGGHDGNESAGVAEQQYLEKQSLPKGTGAEARSVED